MRIGMILDKEYVSDTRVENEASSLLHAGHEVFLYCLAFDDSRPRSEQKNGMQVRRYRVPSYMYSLSALAYTSRHYHNHLVKSLSAFISDHEIEVIHVHDMRVMRSVETVNRNFGLKIVLDLHENQPEIMKYYHHVNTVLGKLLIYPATWKKFEEQYIRSVDKVIVVTNEAKQYYLDHHGIDPSKIVALPNTVVPDFYKDYQIDQEIIERYSGQYPILYWGDTGFRRGTTTAIDAMEYVLEEIPNAKLILAGKSKSDRQLKVYISKSGLGNEIDMPGWQPFASFQSYITASAICICPINRNTHHDTTYANKIFQYLSMGRPIVVSDCPAQQNVVEKYECGLVHEDQNARDLADKIIQLYRDKPFYDRLADNARSAVVNHLNWEKTKQPLLDLYHGI